jgi:protein O-mannosyl-transferase
MLAGVRENEQRIVSCHRYRSISEKCVRNAAKVDSTTHPNLCELCHMGKTARDRTKQSAGLAVLYSGPLAYVILVLASALIFGRSVGFTIDKFDEESILGPNLSYLTTTATAADVVQRDAFFRKPGQNFYRPVQNLSYYLDARIGRGKPPAFFVTNILLHAMASCLLFRLLRDVAGTNAISFATAMFFAINPLFVHAISWIPGRGDLLLAVFTLGAAMAADRFAIDGSPRWLATASLCTLLAMFSKETGVILIVLLPAYIVARRGRAAEVLRRSGIIAGVSVVAAAVMISLMRQVITSPPEWKSFDPFNLIDNLRVFPEIAAKLFVPALLQPLAGYTVEATVLGVVVLAILTAAQRRSDIERAGVIALVAMAWYVLFMLPGAMYTHRFGSAAYDYLEHRGYASSIGLFLLLPSFVGLLRGYVPQRMMSAGTALFLLAYATMGYLHTGHYRNQLSFYEESVESNPNSSMAWFNLGQTKQAANNVDGAVADYKEAITRHPEFVAPYIIYGKTLIDIGQLDSALALLRRGQEIDPSIPMSALLIGNIYAGMDKYDSAASWYAREVSRFPDSYDAAINLGVAQARIGQWTSAVDAFTRAVGMNAGNAQGYYYRGLAFKESGQMSKACSDWNHAASMGDARARQSFEQFCR